MVLTLRTASCQIIRLEVKFFKKQLTMKAVTKGIRGLEEVRFTAQVIAMIPRIFHEDI